MRVMVYEPTESGHRFAYLAHLLPAMHQLGLDTVLVTTKEAHESIPFSKHLAKHEGLFDVDAWFHRPTHSSGNYPIYELADYFEKSLERLRPDHCFLPCGDGISQIIGGRRLFGSKSLAREIDTETLHFSGRFGYPMASWPQRLKRWAARQTIYRAPWSRFYHLDAFQLAALCKGNPEFARRSFVMPDPIEAPPQMTKSEARSAMMLPDDGRFIGCAGGINLRKGIDLLLRAFLAARPRLEPSDRILLAGPVDEGMWQIIKSEFQSLVDADQLVLLDRYLSVEEMAQSMIAMDLVCTPYPKHPGSSSIVIRATAVERPLLAADVNWLGRTVQQLGLGWVCDVCNPTEFANHIVAGLAEARDYRCSKAARKFVEFHSGENFSATWLARVREKLNLQPDEQRVPWEAVEHCNLV